MQAPQLWLNGRQLTGLAEGRAPVLAPVTLTWGTDAGREQPTPANLSFSLMFKESMDDVPDLANGAKVELIDSSTGNPMFAGMIRTMRARPSTRVKGAMEVEGNATDYSSDLANEFISTEWAEGVGRAGQLATACLDAGWELTMPNTGQDRARANYNSIKLMTLIDRFISCYRGRRYDTSYRDASGVLQRRLSVMPGTARSVAADTLLASAGGVWGKTYNPPEIGGYTSPALIIPASNVLSDPVWTQDPGNVVTGVVLSTMSQGADNFTELQDRNYRAPRPVINEFGLRTIDVETDLSQPTDWQTTADAWIDSESPWSMSEATLRDTDLLDIGDLARLLDPVYRYRTLVVITGIQANRPDPGPSDLRSYLMGGTYTWTGKKWEISLILERTISKLTQEGDYWTPALVAASTDPNIQDATCASVGDTLTVADFRFIGEPI